MSDTFPQAHFPLGMPVDEEYFIDDDEDVAVPADVLMILGFDPSEDDEPILKQED